MQAELWKKVESLCQAALAQPPGERASFLAKACPDDPPLRAEVQSLLDQQVDSFLEGSPLPSVTADQHGQDGEGRLEPESTLDRTLECGSAAGGMIGPYRLLEIVGEGGMGEVWLAEQTQPVRRRVALKLIKAGMDTREVVARFESERQALALMDHPAIAKVFDAGSTAQGRPFFVMEYVVGMPVTKYCDKHRLSTHERLELFIRVCEGVQHAHRKAIIHRDLKPSNILVSEVDGKPMPKIIDFGVAKATGQRLTAQTVFTRLGSIVGTPEYMSPEQAGSVGEDIDTRTDVYSLGVVLYELLVGALPVDFCDLRFDEILNKVRDEDASKPSTKLRTLGEESTTAARNRRTEPRTLARLLRGDLDAIALKAIEKDRARRYGSPSEFAADIRRYLNDEPIEARPPSLTYQLQKFARRYRALVASAGAVFLVLVAGVILSSWEATKAHQAEHLALSERDRADSEAATAKAVDDFLRNDLLEQSNPRVQAERDTAVDPNLTIRTALDRAAERVRTRFDGKPLVEAAIQSTIGNAYVQLGLYSEGHQHLERAVDLRRTYLGNENPDTLGSMFDLAFELYRFEHKYAEAEPIFSKLLEVRRRVSGENDGKTLDTMAKLGDVYRYQGKFAKAEPLLTRAVDGFRLRGNDHSFPALDAMNDLALLYEMQGRLADAEALFVTALNGFRRRVGNEHPETLNISNNLAVLYRNEGKYTQAEQLLITVLEIRQRTLSDEHSETQGTINDLATLYSYEGKYAKAEPLLLQLLKVRSRLLGPQHVDTLAAMRRLGELYLDEGKYAKADPVLTKMFEARRGVTASPGPPIAALCSLGDLRVAQHRYAQAETLLREALDALEKANSGSASRYRCEALLGASLAGQKRYASAEPLLLSAYSGTVHFEKSDRAGTELKLIKIDNWIVDLYHSWGKPQKAAEWQRTLDEDRARLKGFTQ